VWLLAAGLVLLLAGGFGAAIGSATVARHRAQAAADLGALAGAMRAVYGSGVACAQARRIVTANGAEQSACRLDGLDVTVTARVRTVVGIASATSRAGSVPVAGGNSQLCEDLGGGRVAVADARWLDPERGSEPGRYRMDLSLSTRTVADHTVLQVGGEVDVYTAPRLRERLVELVDGGARKVVVDLGRVEFLDSTGLGVLVGAHKRLRAAGGSLALVCAREPLLKIFRITALDQVFPLYDSVDTATAAGVDGQAT